MKVLLDKITDIQVIKDLRNSSHTIINAKNSEEADVTIKGTTLIFSDCSLDCTHWLDAGLKFSQLLDYIKYRF